jgi:hypothetical protein
VIQVTNEVDPWFERFLNLTPDDYNNAVCAGVNKALQEGKALVAEACPVITSRLKTSISADTAMPGPECSGQIYTNVKYASFVEYGTGVNSENPESNKQPIVITAKNGKALAFKGRGGGMVFRKKVVIQGMKPRAMFRKNIAAIEEIRTTAIEANIAKLFQ